jgi:hypothetical protein
VGRKKKLRMTVRVVPPGSLRPNTSNPHAAGTPQQRREGMLHCLARALAMLHRQRPASVKQPSE